MKNIFDKYVSNVESRSKKVSMKSNAWTSNALRSLGYSAMDILSEVIPSTMDTARASYESIRDVSTAIRASRSKDKQMKMALNKNFYVNLGKEAWNNSLEDLKSGKFYNKDRIDKFNADMMDDINNMDGFDDFDMGDDYESSGSIVSDDGSAVASVSTKNKGKSTINNISMHTDIGPDSAIVKATEYGTEVSVKVGKAVADTSVANTRATITVLSQFKEETISSLASINNNVASIASSIPTSLSQHSALASKYYEDSIAIQKDILSAIKSSSSAAKPADALNPRSKEFNDVMNLFTSSGGLNISDYASLVKKQMSKYVDSNLILSQLKFMSGEKDTLKMLIQSPLSSISKSITNQLIPGVLKHTMKSFDEQLKETFVAGLNQVSGLSRSNNPILSALGEIFGIQNKIKRKVDKSSYNKDAVAWSGTDHQALTNVIPTLLRKMYATISNTEEIAFDYNKGIFSKVSDIEKNYKDEDLYRKTSNYSDYKSEFSEFLAKNTITNSKEREKYSDQFNKFISSLVMDEKGGRTFRRTVSDRGQVRDDIAELLGSTSESDDVKLIRSFLSGLEGKDNAKLTRFFGTNVQEQRSNYDRWIREQEEDPIRHNTSYVNTGLERINQTNRHMKKTRRGTYIANPSSGIAGTVDQYGKTQHYYLREMLKTLTNGIIVMPIDGSLQNAGSNDDSLRSEILDRRESINNQISIQNSQYRETRRRNDSDGSHPLTESRVRTLRSSGAVDPIDASQSQLDVLGNQYWTENLSGSDGSADTDSFVNKIIGLIPESSGLGKLLRNMQRNASTGQDKIGSSFNKMNQFLFEIVFGDEKGKRGFHKLFDTQLKSIQAGFLKFSSFIDTKILSPLNNALFGDDGLINKIKQSQFGRDAKDLWNRTKNRVLGTKGEDGKRSGGVLSDVSNELSHIKTSVKSAIFGKTDTNGNRLPIDQDDSVFGNIKKIFKDSKNKITSWLGIEPSSDAEKVPLSTKIASSIDSIYGRIKNRASSWADNMFGVDDDSKGKKFLNQFKSDLKGKQGKIGAAAVLGSIGTMTVGSHLGFLGSMFLPGGPIGGALLGAGVGIISQSTGLKDFLFGPSIDNGDGTSSRIGGLITKDFQDFFHDHKMGIGIGAAGGLAASYGLLPSFFLPGGPIGGALVGGAVSIALKTNKIQELLYGPNGNSDDPTGGLTEKFKKIFGKDATFKDLALDAGIGAGVGVVGSFFLPGGPILGALLGAGTSVALGTDKFQKWFFGDNDDPESDGGVFGKFSSFMKKNVFTPLSKQVKITQVKILGFVEENMVLPFKYALAPLAKEASHVKTIVTNKIHDTLDSLKQSLHRNVTKPMGDFVKEKFLDPMSKLLKGFFGGLGKFVGHIIASPFKLIGAAGWGAYDSQKKRGKEAYKKSVVSQSAFGDSAKQTRAEAGVRFGPFGQTTLDPETGKRRKVGKGWFGSALDMAKNYDPKKMNAAQYGKDGASYEGKETTERRQRYKEEIASIRNKTQQKISSIMGGAPGSTDSSVSKRNRKKSKKSSTDETVSKVSKLSEITETIAERREHQSERHHSNIMDTLRDIANNIRHTNDDKTNTKSTVSKGKNRSKKSKKYNKSKQKTFNDTNKPNSDKNDGNYKPSKNINTSQSIAKDVSKISDSVYGQLNGVGKNVNKIYRMLLKATGMKDDDISGDNNKEYVGFLGKIRTMMNRPFKAIGNIIMTPFRMIAKVGTTIKDDIVSAGKFLINGIWSIGKGIGKAAVSILSIPVNLAKGFVSTVKLLGPVVAEGLKVTIGAVGTGIKVGGELLIQSIRGFGSMISGVTKGFGQMVGGALSGLGQLLHGVGLVGADLIKTISHGIIGAGKFLGKAAVSLITAPFKLIGAGVHAGKRALSGKFGKQGVTLDQPIHVIVDSGTLTTVKVVERVLLLEKVLHVGSGSQSGTPSNGPNGSKVSHDLLPLNLQTFSKKISDNSNGNDKEQQSDLSIINTNGSSKDSHSNPFKEFSNILKRNKSQNKEEREREEQLQSGSRTTLVAKYEQEDKEKENRIFRQQLLSKLQVNTDTNKEHHNVWSSIFSKKGLITMGLLLLAPKLIKFLNDIGIGGWLGNAFKSIGDGIALSGGITGVANNIGEQIDVVKETITGKNTHAKLTEDGKLVLDENGNIIDETDDMSSRQKVANLIAPIKTRVNTDTGDWENDYTYTSGSDAAINVGSHLALKGAKRIVTGVQEASKVVSSVVNKNTIGAAGKFITAGVQKVTNSKAGKLVTKGISSVKNSKFIQTFITKGIELLDSLVLKLAKLGDKFGIKIAASSFDDIIKPVIKTVMKAPILGKYVSKISGVIAKMTGSASTLGILDVAFVAWGAIEGASNPAGLFQVRSDAVDLKMRLISTVFKGLLGTSVGSLLDLLDSIVYETMGFSFIKELAMFAYGLLSSKEDEESLRAAQEAFKDDYVDYVDKEYDAYVKSMEEQGKGDKAMSKDEFQQSEYATSFAEYNSEQNKSLVKKAWDGISSVGKGIKNIGSNIASTATAAWDSVKGLGSDIANFFVGSTKDAFYDTNGNYYISSGNGTYDYHNASGDIIASGVSANTVDPMIQTNQLSKGTVKTESGIKKGLSTVSKGIGDFWKTATSQASNVLNTAKDTAVSVATKVSTTVGKGIDKFKDFYKRSTTLVWYDDSRGYYKLNDNNSYDYYNANGDQIAVGIPESKVEEMKHSGLLAEGPQPGGSKVLAGITKLGGIISSTWEDLASARNKLFRSLGSTVGQSTTSMVDSIKEHGIFGGIRDFFTSSTTKGYFDTNGNYYVKQSDGTYTYFNANGDELAKNIPEDTVMDKLSAGLLTEGEVKQDSAAKNAIHNIQSAVASAWDTAKNTVTNAWDSFTNWITGGKGGPATPQTTPAGAFDGKGGSTVSGGFGSGETVNGVPYFSQNDPKYRNKRYDVNTGESDTIGNRGCGPTAMAMVASKLTGKQYDPDTMASMAEAGGYSNENGTSPRYFKDAASTLGIGSSPLQPSEESLVSALDRGQPVILQGRGNSEDSPYTEEGHYVVATKAKGGNVVINDPRGKSTSGAYNVSDVLQNTSGMWAFGSDSPSTVNTDNTFDGGLGSENMTDQERSVVGAIMSREGKNTYSQAQNLRTKVDSGYGDCSSTVQWAYKKALGIDPGGYTGAQIDSANGRDVDSGSTPNEDNLRPGDLLFYRARRGGGHGSSGVGHVEMYVGNNTLMGHGSGIGPSKKNMSTYGTGRYIKARRFINDGSQVQPGASSMSTDGTSTDGSTSSGTSGGFSSVVDMLSGLADAIIDPIYKGLGLKTSSNESANADGSTAVDTSVSGSSIAQQGWNFFTKLGYSKEATAGILGNLQAESGMNPSAIQSNGKGPAAGLAQWENYNTKSARWKQLSEFAQKQGKDWTDTGSQFAFIHKELQELSDGFWNHSGNMKKAGVNPTSYSAWKQSNDINTATRQFEGAFERAGKPRMDARIAAANKYYSMYANDEQESVGGKGGTGKAKRGVSPKSLRRVNRDATQSFWTDGVKSGIVTDMTKDTLKKSASETIMHRLVQNVVDLLSSIVTNTRTTSEGVDALLDKDFGSIHQQNIIESNNTKNQQTATQSNNTTSNNKRQSISKSEYALAKRLAAGILT